MIARTILALAFAGAALVFAPAPAVAAPSPGPFAAYKGAFSGTGVLVGSAPLSGQLNVTFTSLNRGSLGRMTLIGNVGTPGAMSSILAD